MKKGIGTFALGLILIGSVGTAEADMIGIFGDATTEAAAVATGLGHTASILTDLSAGSLTGLDVIWGLNGSNSVQNSNLITYSTEVAQFVNTGGVLLYHDREVADAETVLPGGAGFNIIRDLDATIDILDNSTTVTNGPGGILTDTSLDGGNFSNHGYTVAGSLPLSSLSIFSRTNATEIVDFYYDFGGGNVYYSTIPLDYYLLGATSNLNFANVYAPNVLSFATELGGGGDPVPEPATMLLFGTGIAGLVGARIRRKK